MIIEGICEPIFALLNLIVGMLPEFPEIVAVGFQDLISIGLYFFPRTTWIAIIVNSSLWITAWILWSIVEWVYKKIPGIS